MLKVNEYFDGKVKSIGFATEEGPGTVGVIAPGEYEFGTSSRELMTVTKGRLDARLPGSAEWQTFSEGETFVVEANEKFQVRAEKEVSYICLYR